MTRTLLQLAKAAQNISARTGMNPTIPLVVSFEEKKLLDNFVDGLPGQKSGCTHLHGCPIRVEGKQQAYSRVLLIYQNLNECDFQAVVIDTPSPEEVIVLRNVHNEFAAAGEKSRYLDHLDKLIDEKGEEWRTEQTTSNIINRGPFDFVVICGRNY